VTVLLADDDPRWPCGCSEYHLADCEVMSPPQDDAPGDDDDDGDWEGEDRA